MANDNAQIQPQTYLIVGGAKLLTVDDRPVTSRGTIPATVFGSLVDCGDVLVSGAFTPDPEIVAALELGPIPTVSELALGTDYRDAIANAYIIVTAIHLATERAELNAARRTPREARRYREALADLRRLATWVPDVFFRLPSVGAFLDSRSRREAKRFRQHAAHRGRRDEPLALLRRVFAVELVVRRTSTERTRTSVAKASARVVACSAGRTLNIDAVSLRNLHTRHWRVATAIAEGYAVPREVLAPLDWRRPFESDYAVYGW